ncbi:MULTISPECIES: hypothetical protein [unclassified Sphingobacterium]|uniref:hypothetical protein n=1 Tax=unclassified Sphingobacterium TaxID=2609468 RepID=UPI00104D3F4F|nr:MULTISPECIES: hypothetical protein [unclassified Sphingobacterium]MCS3556080.1 hypothetical protein [Sphingobacterium sp. JUb21]TCR08457.1 hypothetical protein EDF66_1034 [Sphingobacterium sp. JUb20]
MKKLRLGVKDAKGVLSREELRQIFGGSTGSGGVNDGTCSTSSCELVIQNKAGVWLTYYGSCSGGTGNCFCDIGQPVDIPVSSNGGVSRCTR